ncbi:MAG: response regulator [Chrysiogenales bacterium]|nr:MAG: response regulator [Chrysiogenales bacterium]
MIGLIIEVEDTGPGISAEDSKNLFQAFTQTQKGVRAGGTGLGLALSRQFAQLMGGDITVRSEPDRGSCFTVSITVQKGGDARVKKRLEERRVAGVRPGQDTYRVLVADDNEDNRALIRELLAPVGFQIEEAADGEEAIEKFKSWSPHIILMDMRMPVTSGYEAIVRIKDMKGGKETPIVAVTASAFAEDREKVLNWGADGYLRKPFKDHELFDFLKTFLGIEYVYEEDTAPARGGAARPSKPLSPESLRELPDGLIDEMLKATLNLDQDRLMELIDGAGGVNERTIEGLKEMVKSYRYDALIGLLKKRKGT